MILGVVAKPFTCCVRRYRTIGVVTISALRDAVVARRDRRIANRLSAASERRRIRRVEPPVAVPIVCECLLPRLR